MGDRILPFDAPLEDYRRQATELLAAHESGDIAATRRFKEKHPRFLRDDVPWLSRDLSDDDIRRAGLSQSDAELVIARSYDFKDWPALAEFVEAVTNRESPVCRFESAVEAVVNGDADALRKLLAAHPALVHARSTRVTHFDPPVHAATLLHYVAANGVEGHRQKTPSNAVDIARMLLTAGAHADALANMYGGQYTTMSMLVSSSHPAAAGLQVALVDVLVDFGAAVEPRGSAAWGSPLLTALVFGFRDTAEALVRHGAQISSLSAAAGLGRLDLAQDLLPVADADERHRAIALAAQLGHAEVVNLLLDAGEDPNRFNPKGAHAHSTPLHQAALAGHESVVRLLIARGARLDIPDRIYSATPLGWANHGGKTAVAQILRAHGAP